MALTKITVDQLGADSVTTAKIADDVELGGSPTTTTQSAGNNSTRIATTAYTETAITALTSGAALNEYIADTVGAMVGSNTESGITVAYQDGDNTLDFTVGTLNQNTTGTAATVTGGTQAAITSAANLVTVGTIGTGTWQGTAINQTYLVGQSGTNTGDQTSVSGNAGTATALANARTIGGVSFNGSANINLPGVNAAGNQNTSGTAANLSGTPNISVGTIGSGNITTTGYIRGPASFTIDPATHGDDTGTVVIAGNLQVDGTTTTINSTTVSIDDLNFSIATDAANSAAANGAGITIGGAGATLLYTHATTSWDMNKPLNVTGALGVSGVATFGTHVVLGDSDELRFGAGNDARIFSDGTNGYIRGVLALQNSAGNKDFISAADGGATTLYHDNAVKLATASGGVTVTGNITSTGVTSNGNLIVNPDTAGKNTFRLTSNAANDAALLMNSDTTLKVSIQANASSYFNGGNVGIGVTNPSAKFQVEGTFTVRSSTSSVFNDGNNAENIRMLNSGITFNADGTDKDFTVLSDTSTAMLFVDGGTGHVGIGTTSPGSVALLHVKKTGDGTVLRMAQNAVCEWDWKIGGSTAYVSGGSSGDLELMPLNGNMGFGVGTSTGGLNMRVRDGTMTVGKGIKFNAETAAANELDDYEEGLWTPTIASDAGPGGYNYATGYYTKIGRMVHVTGQLRISSVGSFSGATINVGGLPLPVIMNLTNYDPRGLAGLKSAGTAKADIFVRGIANTSYMRLEQNNGYTTDDRNMNANAIDTDTLVFVDLTYFTA
jgi:hypothetical protein